MKTFNLLILFIIVLFAPGKATLIAWGKDISGCLQVMVSLEDCAEQPVEEDDLTEEDDALNEFQALLMVTKEFSSYKIYSSSLLPESPREVTVPPPQG